MSERTTVPVKVKWLNDMYDVNVRLDEPVEILRLQVPTLCSFERGRVPVSSAGFDISVAV
jgi:hypothetical protein